MVLPLLVFSVFLSCIFISSTHAIERSETSDLNGPKREDRAIREKSVAFFAYRSGNLGISSRYGRTYRTIVYDRVDLNIGNAYNNHNGTCIFTAPFPGVYLFHVSTGVCFKSWAIIQLIQNGRIRDISMPDSSMDGGHFRNQATTSTPLYLKKGDSVYVRIGHAHSGRCIESSRDIRTSFSGVKIQ